MGASNLDFVKSIKIDTYQFVVYLQWTKEIYVFINTNLQYKDYHMHFHGVGLLPVAILSNQR